MTRRTTGLRVVLPDFASHSQTSRRTRGIRVALPDFTSCSRTSRRTPRLRVVNPNVASYSRTSRRAPGLSVVLPDFALYSWNSYRAPGIRLLFSDFEFYFRYHIFLVLIIFSIQNTIQECKLSHPINSNHHPNSQRPSKRTSTIRLQPLRIFLVLTVIHTPWII